MTHPDLQKRFEFVAEQFVEIPPFVEDSPGKWEPNPQYINAPYYEYGDEKLTMEEYMKAIAK